MKVGDPVRINSNIKILGGRTGKIAKIRSLEIEGQPVVDIVFDSDGKSGHFLPIYFEIIKQKQKR
jgi:hypothetical protein|tara:strand:- start:275 stop:469 length:195 start_codon:yes stop_codon:yes gene_type:complete